MSAKIGSGFIREAILPCIHASKIKVSLGQGEKAIFIVVKKGLILVREFGVWGVPVQEALHLCGLEGLQFAHTLGRQS